MYTVSTKSKQRYPAISSASGIPLLCVGDVEYMIIGVCVVAIVMANKPSSSSSSSYSSYSSSYSYSSRVFCYNFKIVYRFPSNLARSLSNE